MKRRSTTLIIIICVLAIAIIVGAFTLLQRLGRKAPEIELPETVVPEPAPPAPEKEDVSGSSADLDQDNVLQVLRIMSRADNYCQTYTLSAGGPREVTVWKRGGLLRVTSSGPRQKNVMIAGDSVYIWYDGGSGLYEGPMGSDFSPDDEMGIPTYEGLLASDHNIVEAGYEFSEELQESCIYVRTLNDGVSESYWISCETGLLVMFEAVEDGKCIYSMLQTGIECPVTSEEVFEAAFTLPDGRVLSEEQ